MDVDWAESQVPSAGLRVGERVPGLPARLTRAHAARMELAGNSLEPADTPEVGTVTEPGGLCSGEACVRARSEALDHNVVRVDLDVDALSAALARALVTALDGRMLSMPTGVPVGQAHSAAPTHKRSFWAGAWHADVVLSSVAILVVVVVLLAWTV